ncbi:hypothetical protein WME94_06305 [Sorangium sp. So ce429]
MATASDISSALNEAIQYINKGFPNWASAQDAGKACGVLNVLINQVQGIDDYDSLLRVLQEANAAPVST